MFALVTALAGAAAIAATLAPCPSSPVRDNETSTASLRTMATAHPLTPIDQNPCPTSPFHAHDFVGDWHLDGPGVTTLAADGTMTSHGPDTPRRGSWSFQSADLTTLAPQNGDGCVLWLHEGTPAPAADFTDGPVL